jgi:hypothetical protein
MLKYTKNRFALIIMMILLFIGFALITRIILLFISFGQVDIGIRVLVKVFLVGLFYDIVAAVYYSTPLAVYITLVPGK